MGCRMKPLNLSGQKIGRWTVLSEAARAQQMTMWNCVCDCGTHRVVSRAVLMDKINKVKSCGCWRRENARARWTRHGLSQTPTWNSWSSMMTRCYNKNVRGFENYGGRGIKVCERWHTFENFLEDMGERPSGKHSTGSRTTTATTNQEIVAGRLAWSRGTISATRSCSRRAEKHSQFLNGQGAQG